MSATREDKTQHEYKTTQHEATQKEHTTTRVQHDATRPNTSTEEARAGKTVLHFTVFVI